MLLRRAKIVCTIGPSSCRRDVLFRMIKAGMDVARLNFSHGDHAFHKKAIKTIREGAKKYGRPVAILQDLQGIKIRTGLMEGGAVVLKKGQELLILPGKETGNSKQIFISYKHLLRDVKINDRILLDDGLIELKVTGREGNALRAKVIEGGILRDRKGVNLPGVKITAESFTDKDRADLEFGMQMGVDYVAVSFVRSASDIRVVKEWLKSRGFSVPLIAKIEKPEALDNIDSIIEEADGLMVARGDLGIEVPAEDVPLIQKALIEQANRKGRIVITATQMLESMTEHLRPTRAEVTDVANAVIDGTDALMLSAETSSGKHPLEALRMMDRIIRKTESERQAVSAYMRGRSFSEAVAEAAKTAAADIGARFIVAFTQSGSTARVLSKFRPTVPIVAFTLSEIIRRRMTLYWGVVPKTMRKLKNTDDLFKKVEETLLEEGMAKPEDTIVITASTPVLGTGQTNLIKLHTLRKAT
jgi:pyruvate kinase